MEIKNFLFEEWRPIRGYEGLYEVSNFGRVRNVGNAKTKKVKYRKLFVAKGYYMLALSKGNVKKCYSVHRLVAEAFLPNPDNLPQVNHKDENKLNNFVYLNPDGSVDPSKSNLEWCDGDYNIHYGTGIERRAKSRTHTVIQETMEGDFVHQYNSVAEAENALNIQKRSHIDACCRGKIKSSNGYRWRYV